MNIALFANGTAGIAVAGFLRENGNGHVRVVVLTDQRPELDSTIREHCRGATAVVGPTSARDESFLAELLAQAGVDAIISVYWPWMIPQPVADLAEVTVNFHPSLLPYGRGWYPHVHNLINGTPAGVTLHELSSPVDSGRIWAQRSVRVETTDTASDLHARLQAEILKLFRESWNQIASGQITPTEQSNEQQAYLPKDAFGTSDELDLDSFVRTGDLIDLLRARTFESKGFAYFLDSGQKIFVSVNFDLE